MSASRGHNRITFALLSDLHVTSADSEEAGLARKALEEAHQFDADLVVVAGDLVDNGAVRSMAVARRILDEGPGQARLLAVPGNHDVHPGKGLDVGPTETGAENLRALSIFSAQRGGARPLGASPWPLRLDLAHGRCVVYGLDSNRVTGGSFARGRIGPEQLALLDADLGSLDRDQRRIVVLHHHVITLPIGRMFIDLMGGELTMWLEDRKELWAVLERHRVDLVLHGHRHHYLRRVRGGTRIISCSSTTKGCGLTGQRFVVRVGFDLGSGEVTCDRIHYAEPARVRTLAEVFDTEESMRTWVKLAERAYDSDDTFVAFAKEFQSRDARILAMEGLARRLDADILDLLQPPSERNPSLAVALLKSMDRDHGLPLEDDVQ